MKISPVINEARLLIVQHGTQLVQVQLNCHQQIECLQCKKKKFNCKHATFIAEEIANGNELLDEFSILKDHPGRATNKLPQPISKEPIPLDIEVKVSVSTQEQHFSPDSSGTCEQLHAWDQDDIPFHDCISYNGTYFQLDITSNAVVHYRKCSESSCNNRKLYDGGKDGVLNMEGFLISHKVLREYMRQFVVSG